MVPAGSGGKVEVSVLTVALRVSRFILVSVADRRTTPAESMVTKAWVGRSTVPPNR
ncbi:hypothetical protein D3C83_183140 [compost metagenome]